MPLSPPHYSNGASKDGLTVDQPGHGGDPRRVLATMVAIHLTQALEAPHRSNRVFHNDPKRGERLIVDLIFRGTFCASRFATWEKPRAFLEDRRLLAEVFVFHYHPAQDTSFPALL